MIKTSRAVLALSAACLLGAAAGAQTLSDRPVLESYDASTVIATVGDSEVTLGDVIATRQGLPPQLMNIDRETYYLELIDRLRAQQLLSQAAQKQNLDEDAAVAENLENARRAFIVENLVERIEQQPELADELAAQIGLAEDPAVQRRLGALQRGLLSQTYIQRLIEPKMTDEALKSLYDELLDDADAKDQLTEVRARHILVESQEAAAEIKTALDGGAEFEALAKERSKDGSGQNGGDLGFFRRGQMVPAFDQAAFALSEPGQISDVVQSQFGFHVIKLEERRVMSFESVQDLLRRILIERIGQEEIARLKEEIGFTLADSLPPADAIAEDALLNAN